ncbi:zf-HC2 domain-containing protein [Streptomyces kasugaensis]|uniref:Zf-HC2 domain-containing protein n=1 Tax=Streptomyces kasugaensis TaxID=1946 RepID=A0A4Q9HJ24_STRKA|nr:zf-HC2 domain-containing protein [Streptomyces kasugaensis]TBO54634.1 zf-HC2 domain-containing protein [Streptomyces kasugaensis]
MLCSRIRTALSARLDGEEPPPGHTARGLDGHLAACADCRDWEARARRLAALTAGRASADDREPGASADALLARLRAVSALPGAEDGDRVGEQAG